jgi:hypothetical protein
VVNPKSLNHKGAQRITQRATKGNDQIIPLF